MRGYLLFALTALAWLCREVYRPAQDYIASKGIHDTIWVEGRYTYPLDTATLRHEIRSAGILFPDIVLRQALFETAHLRCKSCSLDSSNLFGFTHPYEAGHLRFPS